MVNDANGVLQSVMEHLAFGIGTFLTVLRRRPLNLINDVPCEARFSRSITNVRVIHYWPHVIAFPHLDP